MGVVYIPGLRETPSNQPCFEFRYFFFIVRFITKTPLRAYWFAPLWYPSNMGKVPVLVWPSNSDFMASSQPFRYTDRSTPATESRGDSTSLGCFPIGDGILVRGFVRPPLQGGSPSPAPLHAAPAAAHRPRTTPLFHQATCVPP